MNKVKALYGSLLKKYGKQGWWPVIRRLQSHYHPGDYDTPNTPEERFQIAVGAILAQNTNWKNAETALLNLCRAGLLNPEKLARASDFEIANLIRPSGYYNQKTRKIQEFVKNCPPLSNGKTIGELREHLLSIRGLGPETADSIILYAYKKPVFVIDTYTKRFCAAHDLPVSGDYNDYREFFESALRKDYRIFNEYHALIVAWGKENKPKV
ncbi:hypothetical protein H0O02_04670 [Candidatus Micrarchaeota archaeon]|nr:hypothetical protein [Candidatus Micrarchaeota archaeon]